MLSIPSLSLCFTRLSFNEIRDVSVLCIIELVYWLLRCGKMWNKSWQRNYCNQIVSCFWFTKALVCVPHRLARSVSLPSRLVPIRKVICSIFNYHFPLINLGIRYFRFFRTHVMAAAVQQFARSSMFLVQSIKPQS